MIAISGLTRPHTFEEGKEYFLRQTNPEMVEPALVRVKFIGYDPCPAFVIVRGEAGKKRCLRDELFLPS